MESGQASRSKLKFSISKANKYDCHLSAATNACIDWMMNYSELRIRNTNHERKYYSNVGWVGLVWD